MLKLTESVLEYLETVPVGVFFPNHQYLICDANIFSVSCTS